MLATVLTAPAAAFAHGSTGPIRATTSTNVPVLDGTLGGPEWYDAATYPLAFPGHAGTLYVKHTATTLYFGARVSQGPASVVSLQLYFDNNHNGVKDAGEDGIVVDPGPQGRDFYYSPSTSNHPDDPTGGGTNDVVGYGRLDLGTGEAYFEASKPKQSADITHDFSVSDGATLGMTVNYFDGTTFFQYPTTFMDTANFVDLVLSSEDRQAPTVTLTSPPGGTTVGGNVPLEATASDNVGVQSVEFLYAPQGSSTFTSISTDTTAPYTGTWDTSTLADGSVWQLRAKAADAAGNDSSHSVSVTIDAGGPNTTITSGPTGVLVGTSTSFSFVSSEAGSTFECRRWGFSDAPPFSSCTSPKAYSELAEGFHTFQVRARDAAGNVDPTPASATFYVLAQTPPGTIVFEADRDGNSEIYSMKPDGTAQTRLTNDPATDVRPTLSPDGTKVAFQSNRSETDQIYIMDADGTDVAQLTTTGANRAPMFSPDGRKIAFESNRNGNWEIYVMSASGAAQTRLTTDSELSVGTDVSPSWSPDGSRLVFDSDRDGNREIYTINAADGSGRTRLTMSAGLDSDPDWSPDGQKILFVSNRGGFISVWTMNVDGTNPVNVSGATNYDADPTWSPSGEHIAFVRDAGGLNFNVWIARADGSAQVKLTAGTAPERNSFPDWAGVAPPPTTGNVSISAGTATVEAGAPTVNLADIPASAIRGVQDASKVESAPLDTIPLDTIPLDTIDLASSPLDTIPLDTIGFTAANLQQNALGGVPLDTIPLFPPKRWETELQNTPLGGVPVNTLTLANVVASAPGVLAGLDLGDVNLVASPLDTIPLAGAALGALPLDTIPVGGTAPYLDDWCALVNAIPGFSCSSAADLGGQSQTLLGLTLQGVPLDTIPLDTIPLDTIDLRNTPLDTIPLDTIPLAGTPLDTIPLDTIDMTESPLDTIPLDTIPLDTIGDLVTCTPGTAGCTTLGEAIRNGHLKQGATLGLLSGHFPPNVTLGNIGRGMPPNVTLRMLLSLLFGEASYDWESFPVDDFPLADYSADGPTVPYAIAFDIAGTNSTVELTATLTNGARYVPGSSALTSASPGPGTVVPVGEPEVTESGDTQTIRWTVPGVQQGVAHELRFRARPGTTLGTQVARAALDVPGENDAAGGPVPLEVVETFEPNNSAAEAKPVAADTLKLSYITSATDKDFFSLPIPPAGTQTKIFVRPPGGAQAADYDVVVYGPAQPPLRSAPLDTIPLQSSQVGTPETSLEQRSQDVSPETLADVPTAAPSGQVVVGSSDVRGPGVEEVDLVSTGEGGSWTIQVTGYNGSFSDAPYVLRVEHVPPPALPACQARTMGGGGTAGTLPSIPADVNTLFLWNQKQFGDLHGAAGASSVASALSTLAGRSDLGIKGAVIPVEANGDVAARYGAWNAEPCSPAKANDVVRSIGALIDNVRTNRPGIENVVLVGSDDVIPMARLVDATNQANEAGYASTLGFASNNQYVAAYALHFLMSDDPYGDTNATPTPNGTLYVPEWGIGRLVETPTEIVDTIDQFLTARGVLDPRTETTTGYEFLRDGATKVSEALRAPGRTGTDLINDTWTRDQLRATAFPATGTGGAIKSLNAHYDQSRLLPADQSVANRQDVLYTTSQLLNESASSLTNTIVLTMGCHSGVTASDSIFGSGTQLGQDWAQTYMRRKAAAFMGNTGYGLGDTVAVLYSELMNAQFATRLDGSLPLGRALTFAKQDYLGTLAAITGFDTKVVNQATLYGLPLWKIGTRTPPAPPAPAPTFTDGATGLEASEFGFSPSFQRNDVPGYGTYYSIAGNVAAVNRRPIEPVVYRDVTQPGLVAHGALVTGLASTDETIDAAYARAVSDSGGHEPELVGLVTFPTQLQQLRTISTPNGARQRLVLTLGQYRNDTTPDVLGQGTQRRFTSASVRVFYSTSNDFQGPAIGPVSISQVGSNVGFAVDVTDTNDVKQVHVLYFDATGTWKQLHLGRAGTRWSGAGPVSGTVVQYFLSGVDAAGNVVTVSDKGDITPVVPPAATGTITASVNGPSTNGWFTGPASVTLNGGEGVAEYSLDGSAYTSYSAPVPVSGDGVHLLVYRGGGSTGTVTIPIDTTGPVIVTTRRAYALGSSGGQLDFDCRDAGSGVAQCTATPAAPNTSTIGTKTYSVHAEDRVGNAADAQGTYDVTWPFTGFLQPISNLPFLNEVTAGRAVPVKFRLGGNRGLDVIAADFPKSERIACDSAAPIDDSVTTTTAGSSSLSYDAATDTYTYTWKTDKAWAGQCRRFVLKLVDNSEHVANFRFK